MVKPEETNKVDIYSLGIIVYYLMYNKKYANDTYFHPYKKNKMYYNDRIGEV